MEFQLSYFKSWKMMLWKCCTQYASKFGKLSSAQDWKRSVFIPIPKKGNAKECSNYRTIVLILHASKVMLKILQARLQQYMKWELPHLQNGFRKGRGNRGQSANICWVIEKAREFHLKKKMCLFLLYWLHQSLSLCRLQITEIFFKKWEYQITLPASWEICMQVKKQQWELDMKQHAGSKLGKEYVKALYRHPTHLT